MDTGNKQSDYLWDGSGEPDPEIQRLETLLERFHHDRPTPVFPAMARQKRLRLMPARVPIFVVSAALAVAAMVTAFLIPRHPAPGWDVTRLAGTPRIGLSPIGEKEMGRLGVGQALETDGQSRAALLAVDTGTIEMEPGSRLRLVSMGAGLRRIALDRGTIHALIWARPGHFVVDTPSAVTVDLGCAYTLQVDGSGAGLVRTSRGWVGFKRNGRESFIPAGAACATRPKTGPGIPYFEDASPEFRSALARFDFADTPQQRAADLAVLLGISRKRDVLTLWHLLTRVEEDQRPLVYDRLQEFVSPPPDVTREGILRLDQPMLDSWWNQLGYDDISVWRHWERSWSGDAPVPEK